MRKLTLNIVIVAIITVVPNCNISKNTISKNQSWIPTDFNPAKTVLLVQKFPYPEKTGQLMEDYMKEKYPFKYEFVTAATIKSKTGKYANTKIYKYALVLSMQNSTLNITKGVSTKTHLPAVGFDFNFIDRSTEKNYPTTNNTSSFAITTFKPVINTIIHKYE